MRLSLDMGLGSDEEEEVKERCYEMEMAHQLEVGKNDTRTARTATRTSMWSEDSEENKVAISPDLNRRTETRILKTPSPKYRRQESPSLVSSSSSSVLSSPWGSIETKHRLEDLQRFGAMFSPTCPSPVPSSSSPSTTHEIKKKLSLTRQERQRQRRRQQCPGSRGDVGSDRVCCSSALLVFTAAIILSHFVLFLMFLQTEGHHFHHTLTESDPFRSILLTSTMKQVTPLRRLEIHNNTNNNTNNNTTIYSNNAHTSVPSPSPSSSSNNEETLEQIKQYHQPLTTPLDIPSQNQYTIRINTYRRNEQLRLSLRHHTTCPGVAQIQVVWCDSEYDPPNDISNHQSGIVIIEKHDQNTLNERFRILSEPPTMGIFSLDDDLLWPCDALDSGFFKWVKAPDRIVGYDPRFHIDHGHWKYAYMSTTQHENKYSMVLLRSAFLHRDYMNLYMSHLPSSIFSTVSQKFNCEDIAMSLFVSALTNGLPPLLADRWATQLKTKLYVSKSISGTQEHKHIRDQCMNDFASILQLKKEDEYPLQSHEIIIGKSTGKTKKKQRRKTKQGLFHQGAPIYLNDKEDDEEEQQQKNQQTQPMMNPRETNLFRMEQTWSNNKETFRTYMFPLLVQIRIGPMKLGLLTGTKEWKQRWGHHNHHHYEEEEEEEEENGRRKELEE